MKSPMMAHCNQDQTQIDYCRLLRKFTKAIAQDSEAVGLALFLVLIGVYIWYNYLPQSVINFLTGGQP